MGPYREGERGGRGAVFASQMTGISLWSRCSGHSNNDCELLLVLVAKGLMAHDQPWSLPLAPVLTPVWFFFSLLERRGCRVKASALASSFGLFPSAVRRWLVIYRNQRRAERLQLPQLLERHGLVGPAPAHASIQENKAEVDSEEWDEKWLG